MNSLLNKTSGLPTYILSGGEPVFDNTIERIVVVQDAEIITLSEPFFEGSSIIDNEVGSSADSFGNVGQNVYGKLLPAGTILIPTAPYFNKVECQSGMLELHLNKTQKLTASRNI